MLLTAIVVLVVSSVITGIGLVLLQQIPLAVTVAPPLLVMVPPPVAVEEVIAVTGTVITCANVGGSTGGESFFFLQPATTSKDIPQIRDAYLIMVMCS
jgi:hypothetical protein